MCGRINSGFGSPSPKSNQAPKRIAAIRAPTNSAPNRARYRNVSAPFTMGGSDKWQSKEGPTGEAESRTSLVSVERPQHLVGESGSLKLRRAAISHCELEAHL